MIAGRRHELLVEAAKDPMVVRALLKVAQVEGEATDVVWPDGAHPPDASDADSSEDTALSRIKIFRPDAVKVFSADGRKTLAVAVEVQDSTSPKKRWSWVYYPGRLYMDHDCEALTLVITVSDSLYRWAKRQHAKIPKRMQSQVLVVGPPQIPSSLTDEEAAQSLGLAILVAARRAAIAPTSPPQPALRGLVIAMEERLKTDPNAMALWYRLLTQLFTREEVDKHMNIDTDWMPSEAMQEIIGVDKIRLQFELAHERFDRAEERNQLQAKLAQKDAKLAQKDAEAAQNDAQLAQKDAQLAQKDAEAARAVVQAVVEVRGWALTPAQEAALATDDLERLQAMRARVTRAERPEDVFLLD